MTTGFDSRAAALLFSAIALFTGVMHVLAEVVGRLLQWPELELSALVLASTFPNVGNFGIPVSEFAFGQTGQSTAAMFVVGQNVLLYTVGIFIASRACAAKATQSIKRVLGLLLLYVVLLALAVNALGIAPPADESAMQTVKLLGDASITIFLFALV